LEERHLGPIPHLVHENQFQWLKDLNMKIKP
jgi:hypothetical protein